MALDEFLIADANEVQRKVVGKYNSASQFQQGVHMLGPSRSDTFTTTANGTAVNVADVPVGHFGLQVKQTGTVTSWTVVLEVSLDGTNYATVLTHTKTDNGDGAIAFSGPNKYPALHFRARCSAITLGGGTNVVATIVGLP
jgi:hypothetical protein